MEMRATVDEMRNKIKIGDWLSLTTLFDKLNKQLEKVQRASNTSAIPGFYFRALATLEAAIESTFANKPAIKKMSSTNAKAFNSIRQRLKKHSEGRRDDGRGHRSREGASGLHRGRGELRRRLDSDSDSEDEEEKRAEGGEEGG